ncbi:hypothetical protein LWI28_026888 [Acer negundo]|uniref:Uncharacterized protein n=1 Tax=Acer negundo TaxID=4023 RepID=A0AAD5J878_ACENE|nr:hypothetical protein LWI28_026888 [Acer negundo]
MHLGLDRMRYPLRLVAVLFPRVITLPAFPTALPAALPDFSPSLSAINTGTLPRSNQALTTPPPSPVGYQSSPPLAVLPNPPTACSPLSGMAARVARILHSSGQTHKQTPVTPPMQPEMV